MFSVSRDKFKMPEKILISGIYKGTATSMVIGGKKFLPNIKTNAFVDEPTFLFLKQGVENGWFELTYDEYEKFKYLRNR